MTEEEDGAGTAADHASASDASAMPRSATCSTLGSRSSMGPGAGDAAFPAEEADAPRSKPSAAVPKKSGAAEAAKGPGATDAQALPSAEASKALPTDAALKRCRPPRQVLSDGSSMSGMSTKDSSDVSARGNRAPAPGRTEKRSAAPGSGNGAVAVQRAARPPQAPGGGKAIQSASTSKIAKAGAPSKGNGKKQAKPFKPSSVSTKSTSTGVPSTQASSDASMQQSGSMLSEDVIAEEELGDVVDDSEHAFLEGVEEEAAFLESPSASVAAVVVEAPLSREPAPAPRKRPKQPRKLQFSGELSADDDAPVKAVSTLLPEGTPATRQNTGEGLSPLTRPLTSGSPTEIKQVRYHAKAALKKAVTERRLSGLMTIGNACRGMLQEKLRNSKGIVALMLPVVARRHVDLKDLHVMAMGRLSFGDSERCLWVLSLKGIPLSYSVHTQVNLLRALIERKTEEHKADDGPWVWPLHMPHISLCVFSAHLLSTEMPPLWRAFLWSLRLWPQKDGDRSQHVLEVAYGPAVGYVFAWSSLYMQGLWVLSIFLLVWYIALGDDPGETGTSEGRLFNIRQMCVLVWMKLLGDMGASRNRVRAVNGVRDRRKTVGLFAPDHAASQSRKSIIPVDSVRNAIRRFTAAAVTMEPGRQSTESDGGPLVSPQMTLASAATRATRATRAMFAAPEPPRRSAAIKWSELQDMIRLTTAMHITDDMDPHTRAQMRWRKAFVALRMDGADSGIHTYRNRAHVLLSSTMLAVQRFFAFLFGTGLMSVYMTCCCFLLAAALQLNVHLTYVWGRCIEEEVRAAARAQGHICRDPQFVRGIGGWAAEVGSDIMLAILFDVVLGEGSKALADMVVQMWNHRFEFGRKYWTVMLGLFVEIVTKVGWLVLIGFSFLPRWVPDSDGPFLPQEHCQALADYRWCKVWFQCDLEANPTCCANAFRCIAQRLDFEDRKFVFQKSLRGPFVVAPFVRLAVTVIVPWLSARLERVVAHDTRDAPVARLGRPDGERPRRRRCGRNPFEALGIGILRILALIFSLDGDTLASSCCCQYITHGWPFGEIKPAHPMDGDREMEDLMAESLVQASRKKFDTLDEILELRLNFLFVSFFAPLAPIGLWFTLLARLLEVRFKASKLLAVRRRDWPASDYLLHRTQGNFTQLAIVLATIWHTGLLCLSFNPDVGEWTLRQLYGVWLGFFLAALFFVFIICFILERLARSFHGWLNKPPRRRIATIAR